MQKSWMGGEITLEMVTVGIETEEIPTERLLVEIQFFLPGGARFMAPKR